MSQAVVRNHIQKPLIFKILLQMGITDRYFSAPMVLFTFFFFFKIKATFKIKLNSCLMLDQLIRHICLKKNS